MINFLELKGADTVPCKQVFAKGTAIRCVALSAATASSRLTVPVEFSCQAALARAETEPAEQNRQAQAEQLVAGYLS